jgi:arylsulfatase A-like enzyme
MLMDTVRADRLSCYGYPRRTTPNIDAIAKESIQFLRSYSTSPWTPPAHASLFTGLCNSKHGVFHGHIFLERTYSTLAEVLSAEGYRTAAFSNNPWVSQVTELTRGFEESVEKWERQNSVRDAAILRVKSLLPRKVYDFLRTIKDKVRPPLKDKGAYSTNLLIQNWLTETEGDSRPFFMFINYMEAHLPYAPPHPYKRTFVDEKHSDMRVLAVNQDMRKQWAGTVRMTADDFEILGGLYDSELAYLDFRMGELVRYLRDTGILDNTILIITSDHGENLGDHGLMDHQLCLYDTLLRIPLLIRFPSKLGAGANGKDLVSIVDIFPTVLGLLGINFSFAEELQGRDVFSTDSAEHIYAEYESPILEMTENRKYYPPDFDPSVFDRTLKVARDLRYKLIFASDNRHELFDTISDPEEKTNVYGSNPETASDLEGKLKAWLVSFRKAEVSKDRASLGGLVREKLSELGYF